jgi:hypothetical protein
MSEKKGEREVVIVVAFILPKKKITPLSTISFVRD